MKHADLLNSVCRERITDTSASRAADKCPRAAISSYASATPVPSPACSATYAKPKAGEVFMYEYTERLGERAQLALSGIL